MPAPSLTQLTSRALAKNISMLTDIGDIPYGIIRPVLLKIENPKQLQLLEEVSPQLYGADEEIWISLIKRDIPDGASKLLYPRNPKSWWKVYRKMREDYEAVIQDDAAKLKAAFSGIQSAKDNRQIKMLPGTPKIPKLDGMQYAHAAEYNRIKKPKPGPRPTSSTALTFGNGSRTKVLTGKGVMDKARREAQDMARFRQKNVLSTPTHKLNNLATQVQAPRWKIEEIRKAPPKMPADHTIPKPAMFRPPQRRVENKPAQGDASCMTFEERERRLRALTNPSSVVKTSTTEPSSNTSTNTASSTKRPHTISETPATATPAITGPTAKRPSASATISPASTSKTLDSSAKRLPATAATSLRSTSTAPKSTAKMTAASSSAPSLDPEAKPSNSKASVIATSTSTSTHLKRKAEDSIIPSNDVDDRGSTSIQLTATPSPSQYKVPLLSRSSSPMTIRPMKKKAPVDVFMPVKKRRVN